MQIHVYRGRRPSGFISSSIILTSQPHQQVFDESALMLGLQPNDVRGMLFEDALVHKHNRMLALAAKAMGAIQDSHSTPSAKLHSNSDSHPDADPNFVSDLNPVIKCDPGALQILVAEAVGQRVDLERKIIQEMQNKKKRDNMSSGSVPGFYEDTSKHIFQQHHQTMLQTLQRYQCMVVDSIGDLSNKL